MRSIDEAQCEQPSGIAGRLNRLHLLRQHCDRSLPPPSHKESSQKGPNSPTGFPATCRHEILSRPPGHHKELFEAGRELWGGLGVPWQFTISLKIIFQR